MIAVVLVAGGPFLKACDKGTAVPDPGNNPGLVADCRALLAIRDELAGNESLNWDAGLAITDWQGVTVSGSPGRVTVLDMSDEGLSGEVPAGLEHVTRLRELHLCCSRLRGEIPAELSKLSQLRKVVLEWNKLEGGIPAQLGRLSHLERLDLDHNRLTGEIPAELGRLSQLERLET